eukprot:192636-Prymnesium_polylepis.3
MSPCLHALRYTCGTQLMEETSFTKVFASLTNQLVCIPQDEQEIDYSQEPSHERTVPVRAPKHSIVVEVPLEVPEGRERLKALAISTLSNDAAEALKDREAPLIGEFAFSPVVRISTSDELRPRRNRRNRRPRPPHAYTVHTQGAHRARTIETRRLAHNALDRLSTCACGMHSARAQAEEGGRGGGR